MIRIARLVGESYDFESGRELGKGLVLTNGISERQVEATPAQISAVLDLFSELAQVSASKQQEASARVASMTSSAPVNGQMSHRAAPPPRVEDEREVGEEYMDADTGTQSI